MAEMTQADLQRQYLEQLARGRALRESDITQGQTVRDIPRGPLGEAVYATGQGITSKLPAWLRSPVYGQLGEGLKSWGSGFSPVRGENLQTLSLDPRLGDLAKFIPVTTAIQRARTVGNFAKQFLPGQKAATETED